MSMNNLGETDIIQIITSTAIDNTYLPYNL